MSLLALDSSLFIAEACVIHSFLHGLYTFTVVHTLSWPFNNHGIGKINISCWVK